MKLSDGSGWQDKLAENIDDLLILMSVATLSVIAWGFGHTEMGNNLASAFAGAAAMYVKGK